MIRLSERERGTLKLGGLVIAMLILGFRALPEYLSAVSALRQREESIRLLASRVANRLATVATTRASWVVIRAEHLSAMTRVVMTGRGTTAASELAATIARAADDAGLSLDVLIPEIDSTSGGRLRRVSVRCEGAGDIAALADFLAFIETDSLLLRVPKFTVAASNPYGPPTEAERLRVTITVEALSATVPDSVR